jgi:pilus assembly protein CpaE
MRVFIASENEAVNARIRQHLSRKGHECVWADLSSPQKVAAQLVEANPSFSVFVLSPNPDRILPALETARGAAQMRSLAIGPATDPQLILRSLRAGCDHYGDETKVETELDDYVSKLTAEGVIQTPTGKFFCVLGASGGCGSSTLAVNLATVLAQHHKSCALYDLKPGVGDLAALLDLKPSYTLADLCVNGARFDRAVFERSLIEKNGVHLLAPPRTLQEIRVVTPEGVKQAINMARMAFGYVVADLDDCIHEEQVQALQLADVVLLVLRLDFTSLRNAQRVMEHLEAAGLNRENVQLVVNRFGQPKELSSGIAEQALKMKIAHYVPDDPKTVNRANNNGVPAVVESPRATVSKSIMQLAARFNGQAKV